MWVPSMGWEDPLEKGKATHSSILAWRSPWTVSSMGSQRVGHGWATSTPPATTTNFPDINTIYYVSPSRNIVSILFTGVMNLIINPSHLNSSADPALPLEVSVTAMLAGKTHMLGFHLVSFRQRPWEGGGQHCGSHSPTVHLTDQPSPFLSSCSHRRQSWAGCWYRSWGEGFLGSAWSPHSQPAHFGYVLWSWGAHTAISHQR